MNATKQRWYPRILLGGASGIALHLLLGFLLGGFTLLGSFSFHGFLFPDCGFSNWANHLQWLGELLSFALFFLFGAEVGVATLPFADSGSELILRSAVHFAVMAVTVGLWGWLNFPGAHPEILLWFLIPLASVYFLVWMGRWIGWYMEVAAIREKLGLAPGPSLFHWKETLPYLGFACFLCLLLPLGLRLVDDRTPVLSVMYAWLLLPVGGFMSGMSLGRRHGLCPLYPAACTLCILIFIPIARLFTNMSDGHLILIALFATLLGNAAGAVRYKLKHQRRPEP